MDPDGWYVLVNRGSGKALDVSGASTADGAGLAQWTRHDGANQRFQFVDSGGGYYRLKAQHSGKVLDVHYYSGADHAGIVQWSDANGTNQQFRLADSPDGYVRLINPDVSKALSPLDLYRPLTLTSGTSAGPSALRQWPIKRMTSDVWVPFLPATTCCRCGVLI